MLHAMPDAAQRGAFYAPRQSDALMLPPARAAAADALQRATLAMRRHAERAGAPTSARCR